VAASPRRRVVRNLVRYGVGLLGLAVVAALVEFIVGGDPQTQDSASADAFGVAGATVFYGLLVSIVGIVPFIYLPALLIIEWLGRRLSRSALRVITVAAFAGLSAIPYLGSWPKEELYLVFVPVAVALAFSLELPEPRPLASRLRE
jgi:hypothetical protein